MTLTQGSHFDGISAFPLAASHHGIQTLWATEIEPFPVAVSKHHFPHIRHYGDITQVSGDDLVPVDIITFGSPCQDLSVAGKREGLYGERSGLFMEAIRTIREMREATDGKYPRFAIWENVPGAFSSNGGLDFKAVLEEITESKIPMPKSGKWATAGMVRGNGRSIAWRTMDAEYWGVPQRRRRIFLVADFAGQCAPEILFEPQGVSGYPAESRKAREEAAAGAGDGVETAGILGGQHPNAFIGDGRIAPTITEAMGMGGGHVPITAQCLTTGTGRRYDPEKETLITVTLTGEDKARCLTTRADSSPCVDRGQNVVLAKTVHPDIAGTLCASGAGLNRPAGMGSETDLFVATCYDPKDLGRRHATFEDKSPTTKARCGTGGNNVPVTVDCRNLCEQEVSTPLQSKGTGGYSLNYQNPVRVGYAVRRLTPLECERLQGFPDYWTLIPGVGIFRSSDTARYKAIGNSIAVPCLEFIYSQLVKVVTL